MRATHIRLCEYLPAFCMHGHGILYLLCLLLVTGELEYKCFLKLYRNFLTHYYTVPTSYLSLPGGHLENNPKVSEKKYKLSYLLEIQV